MVKWIGQLCAALTLWGSAAAGQSLPDGPGKDLVETICTECHELTRVIGQQRTKADWQLKVTEMLQEDQDVSQIERDTIINYLAAHFPKKVNVNKAGAKELENGLEVSAKEAEAIVGYRADKGGFKTVDDLKKVPGLDAAKVEARKERLEF